MVDELVAEHSWHVGVTNAYVQIDQDYKLTDKNVVKVVSARIDMQCITLDYLYQNINN